MRVLAERAALREDAACLRGLISSAGGEGRAGGPVSVPRRVSADEGPPARTADILSGVGKVAAVLKSPSRPYDRVGRTFDDN